SRPLHSIPTRRSSDLPSIRIPSRAHGIVTLIDKCLLGFWQCRGRLEEPATYGEPASANSISSRTGGLLSRASLARNTPAAWGSRSEEHTSELQSRFDL